MKWKFGKKAATAALFQAVKEGSLQDAKEALRCGADVNGKESLDLVERAPLLIAVQNNNIEMAQLLLNNSANINDKNAVGNTALIEAVDKKHPDIPIVQLLINNNADVNITGFNGHTALMWAIFYEHTEIARQLMDKKADLNAANGDGSTALILAVTMGRDCLAQQMVERGAALDIKDGDGKTALDYARMIEASYQGSHIAQMLEDAARKLEIAQKAAAKAAADSAERERLSAARDRTAQRRQDMKRRAGKKFIIKE
jgi:ankyrin repeat protein